MPYLMRRNGEEICLYKEGPDGEPEGEALGCHDTEDEARAQMEALMAREGSMMKATVKALGAWTLDVLGVPYGGPFKGKDAQGEYFTADTDLWLEKIPSRPVIFYHGLAERTHSAEVIGRELSHERRPDGVWFKVLLDKTNATAQRVWAAAQKGLARASSGAIAHLVRKAPDGQLTVWPLAELSLLDERYQPVNPYAVVIPAAKAQFAAAGLTFPTDLDPDAQADATGAQHRAAAAHEQGKGDPIQARGKHMEQAEIEALVQQRLDAALKAQQETAEAEARRKADEAEKAALKAENDTLKAEAAKARRLPGGDGSGPVIGQFGYMRRYDHMDAADLACVVEVLKGASKPISDHAFKALAVKLVDEAKDHEYAARGVKAMVDAGLPFEGSAVKADELNRSTLASYGDEWAVTANSSALWEQIRKESPIMSMIPSVEVPQGSEAISIPIEGTDPVFYKVAQAADDAATGGLSEPVPTVTSSRLNTPTKGSLTVAKLGARVRWTGELDEDSIIPWAPNLRRQIAAAATEYMDHVVIDGDTRTTATTNINDIGGTPAGTEAYLVFNGFRYIALTTSGRNRSGGAVDEDDFLDTAKLLGPAGKGADPNKVAFLVDPNTHRKLLKAITALKTADVYPGAPTISNGRITQIWGYPVIETWGMGYVHTYSPHSMTGYEHQFDTAGKVNQDTAANNTTGAILLVRWDRWYLGWKRRMTMEVTRYPKWDGSEIVALTRLGLVNRDTVHASAITYNVTL